MLREVLCCSPLVRGAPTQIGYDRIFRVTVVSFLDRFNFCLAGVKRSCIHFVTGDGRIIPFDTYNMFHRLRTPRPEHARAGICERRSDRKVLIFALLLGCCQAGVSWCCLGSALATDRQYSDVSLVMLPVAVAILALAGLLFWLAFRRRSDPSAPPPDR